MNADDPLASEAVDADGIAAPFGAYSQAVIAPSGRRLMVFSGRLGVAADGSCPQGVRAQAELILRDIDLLLRAAGGDRSDVLRLSAFVTERAHMGDYMKARDAWVSDLDPLPASTLMIVSGFTRPEFLVEIEALAALR
ncbi:RidA family protein [Palleronia sp. LCG004]|uniref:RidA family protein n=1 Tax=Palleronia sp. LCG004 TaxID=3079304 RepID=UPI00294367B7|nr:RidA family protein [Palleronia sp. LCG004]WOI58336.1 RidA family protein [Palleronia sp. LCG004]